MAYESLFRKYRSQDFEALSGQAHVTETLRNALRLDRVAQAYLFCGPRGTGKTSSARILAKALNCVGPDPAAPLTRPPEKPCDRCKPCREIMVGSFLDVTEIDAASHTGIDNIRDIVIAKADFPPVEGRKKVYVIDEVHKLSSSAFNALLKTLEEPPPHVVFILATTDPHSVPTTIVSRCQRFDFRRISQKDVRAHLERVCKLEGFHYDEEALDYIAEACDGGMRDALVLLEQAAAFAEKKEKICGDDLRAVLGGMNRQALFELTGACVEADVAGALARLDNLVAEGCDLVQMARDLLGHFRGLLICKVSGAAALEILKTTPEYVQQLTEQATRVRAVHLMEVMTELTELARALKEPSHARLNWEMALIRVIGKLRARAEEPSHARGPVAPREASPPPGWEQMAARVGALEASLRSGAGAPADHALVSRLEALERSLRSGAGAPADPTLALRLEAIERSMRQGAGAPADHPLVSRLEALERRIAAGISPGPAAAPASPGPPREPLQRAPASPVPPTPFTAPAPASAAPPRNVPPPQGFAPPPGAGAGVAPPRSVPPPQGFAPSPGGGAGVAPPPAAPPAAAVDMAAFHSAWKAMPDLLRREKKMPLRGVLMEAYPLAVEGNTCVAGIDKGRQFHYDRIHASKAEVAEHLGQLMKRTVAFEVRLHDGPPPPAGRAPAAPSAEEQHRNFVEEGRDLFNGKIL